MANLILAINYIAESPITINRIVKPGAADTGVVQASAATDSITGVVNELSVVTGERVDVVHQGVAWVEAGAAIVRGAPITSDANGRGITAAPAAGSNVRILGMALESASAAGDVVRVLLEPGYMQG